MPGASCIEAVSQGSTSIKVRPDATGALKKWPQAISKFRGGRNTKIHLVAANDRTALKFSLSPGQVHDAQQGCVLLKQLGPTERAVHLLMDRAYEGSETCALATALGFNLVAPPSQKRLDPWEYDKALYKWRNAVERLFRRLKGFRRVFIRYQKLDVMFIGVITFALIIDELRLY